jgi:hypothetical protein
VVAVDREQDSRDRNAERQDKTQHEADECAFHRLALRHGETIAVLQLVLLDNHE